MGGGGGGGGGERGSVNSYKWLEEKRKSSRRNLDFFHIYINERTVTVDVKFF